MILLSRRGFKMVGVKARNMITNTLLDLRELGSETEVELFRMGLLAVAVRLEKRRA